MFVDGMEYKDEDWMDGYRFSLAKVAADPVHRLHVYPFVSSIASYMCSFGFG